MAKVPKKAGSLCCIQGCNNYTSLNKDLSFCSFPKKGKNDLTDNWRAKLIAAVARPDGRDINPDTRAICTAHFDKRKCLVFHGKGYKLVPGSLPTLKMPYATRSKSKPMSPNKKTQASMKTAVTPKKRPTTPNKISVIPKKTSTNTESTPIFAMPNSRSEEEEEEERDIKEEDGVEKEEEEDDVKYSPIQFSYVEMSDDEDRKPTNISVSCGPFQGRLWMDKFICPGIHQKCIEVDGELMTPKSFCVIGDKQKLKDWKNAIRINGRSVRKLMDSGEFDFYNHDEICTGRCMSRHCGPSKYDSKIEKIQQKNFETANWDKLLPTTKEFEPPSYKVELEGPAYSLLRKFRESSPETEHVAGSSVVFPGMDLDDSTSQKMDLVIKQEVCSDDETLDMHLEAADFSSKISSYSGMLSALDKTMSGSAKSGQNGSSRNRRKNPVPQQIPSNGKSHGPSDNPHENGFGNSAEFDESKVADMLGELPDTEALLEDSLTFWQGIVENGLLEQVIRDAQLKLEYIKRRMMQEGVTETESRRLSDVVTSLGLRSRIKWRMAEHKAKTERETQKLLQELQELRKKVAESEVKQEVLKRKADCFDSLLERVQPKRAAVSSERAASEGSTSSNHASSSSSKVIPSEGSTSSNNVASEGSTSPNHIAADEPTPTDQVPSIATVARSLGASSDDPETSKDNDNSSLSDGS